MPRAEKEAKVKGLAERLGESQATMLAGLAKSQLSRTAWALQGLQSRFVGLMQALSDKLPEDGSMDEPSASASGTGGVPSAAASGSAETSGEPEGSKDETEGSEPETQEEGGGA